MGFLFATFFWAALGLAAFPADFFFPGAFLCAATFFWVVDLL